MLTLERLHQVLAYDPATGEFTWKMRESYTGKKQTWNIRFAGKEAGYLKSDPKSLTHYRIIEIDNRLYRAHRLAWLYMTGEWPSADIDHRDLSGSNNRWDNLRLADTSQNLMNIAPRSNNTSGVKGVCWDRARQKWKVEIRAYGKRHQIGRYSTIEDAAAAYEAASHRYHGKFGRTSGRLPQVEMHA